jgi:hypothetical protein
MLLQYIKKISAEDMTKFLAAKEKVNMLFNLDNNAFLCRDIEASARKKSEGTEVFSKKTQIKKEVSSFVEPRQELMVKESAIFFREVAKKEAEGSMFFECGELPCCPWGISVFLRKGLQKNPFSIGPFYRGAEKIALFKEPNILEIASYFCNRLPLYKQIHDILIFNQQGYEKALGKAFTEDLISLFSAETAEKETNKIKVPHTNIKKELLSSYSGKDKEPKKLISLLYSGLENHKEKGITGHYDTGNIKIEIFLRGENKLVINATLLFPLEDFDQTLEKAARDKIFNFAVNFRVEEWLRQYVFMASFGMKLLEKVKTKLLLENV